VPASAWRMISAASRRGAVIGNVWGFRVMMSRTVCVDRVDFRLLALGRAVLRVGRLVVRFVLRERERAPSALDRVNFLRGPLARLPPELPRVAARS
jgi:hypothetical protein